MSWYIGQWGKPRVEFLPGGCWEWIAYRNPSGYGEVKPAKGHRTMLAHRWVYEMFRGPIARGHELDHLCRNRACVNPDHLEPVMPAINTRRGCRTKLSESDVAVLREALAQWDGSTRALARLLAPSFGVSAEYLKNVLIGNGWAAPRPRKEQAA